MKVLLTGAAGFVGSHVARLLVREGCDVHALVRPGSSLFRIGDVQSRLQLIQGDLLRLDDLVPALAAIKPEICVHLGWCAKPGEYLHSPENVDLMAGTIRLAARLAALGCRRFVGVGTCFEYDTRAGYLGEETPLKPAFLYSAAKAGTFMALHNLSLGEMTFAWARLFYLYGPFENEARLVPSVLCALLRGQAAKCTGGEQIRDFLHVEDVAAALWAIVRSPAVGALNVGSGSPVSVADIVTSIGDLAGRRDLVELGALPYAAGDPMFVCADTRRLREATAWRPKIGLRDGLERMVDWWRVRVPSGASSPPR
jgi:nucleoside-diphosphate-sugar epimerase